MDDYNSTHGLARAAVTLMAPEEGRNGNGTLIQVSFRLSISGFCILRLDDVKLSDSNGSVIYPIVLHPGAPVASFTQTADTVFPDTSITFDPSSSYDPDGIITLYEFDFNGDGIQDWISNASDISMYTYTLPGTYTVTLRVTDNEGQKDLATSIVTVLSRCPVALFTESVHTASVGTPITFDPSGSYDSDGTITLYEFDFDGDGVFEYSSGSPSQVAYNHTSPGVFMVTLRVTDDDGLTDTVSAEKTITSTFTMIESCDSTGTKKDTFDLIDDVYVMGGGYTPLTTLDLYMVNDTAWIDGMAIPPRVPGTATTVTSDASGAIPTTLLWNNPLFPMKYDIVIDVNCDGIYDENMDVLDDSDIKVTAGLNVIPEVPLGILMTNAAMLTALISYLTFSKRRKKHTDITN